jgi:hypothetical protein
MFRSARGLVVPQAEHGRMAGAIAAMWAGSVPLPFERLVRGVTLHDRGYGELDDDPIGAVSAERWTDIQRRGFRERSGDPVVDLVVALHIRRLIGDDEQPARAALAQEIDAELPQLLAGAGTTVDDARRADGVTELCDAISFAHCTGEPDEGRAAGIRFRYDGRETTTLGPWPLAVPFLNGVVGGFEADGYPERLMPVVELFRLEPRQ